MITRPMLAPNDDWEIQKDFMPFPGVYSPKADGFRCYKANGKATTRSGKIHPNPHVVKLVSILPDGLDGELTVGKNFRSAQSELSREYGEPDFTYQVFDYVKDSLNKPFVERLHDLNQLILPDWCIKLPQYTITNMDDLLSFESWCIENNFEGFMGRKIDGIYKCGRSTLKQGLLLKGKRFTDSEARIKDILEQTTNLNEAYKNELGFTARSNHQANKVGNGLMGKLLVEDIHNGKVFELGTGIGWDIPFREELFKNKEKYLNGIVVYKFLDHGDYDLPRNASMKGFRDSWDMSQGGE